MEIRNYQKQRKLLLATFNFNNLRDFRKFSKFEGSIDDAYKILKTAYNKSFVPRERLRIIKQSNLEYYLLKEAKKEEARRNNKLEKIRENMASRLIKKAVANKLKEKSFIKENVWVLPKENGQYTMKTLKAGFKKFVGDDVVVVYIVNSNEYHDEDNTNPEKLNKEYKVPTENFSSWWHVIGRDFWIDSVELIFDKYENNGKLIIYKNNLNLSVKRVIQSFRDGISHCVFQPIRIWGQKSLDQATSKTAVKRYKKILNDIDDFEKKYKDGLPEGSVNEVCNKLQVDIEIELPFSNVKLVNGESIIKKLKKFKFVNTRLNHIELNEVVNNNETIELSQEEFNKIKQKLDDEGKFYTYTKSNKQVNSLSTLNQQYKIKNEYSKAVADWVLQLKENGCDMNSYKIDDIDDNILSEFIKEGTNYNSTVDFVNDINEFKSKKLNHADMEKAYANFKSCKYYSGFLGKITDFRKTDKIEGTGLYRITDLSFQTNKLSQLNDKMRIYVNNNVYTSAELEMLKDNGVSFKVVSGCWGVKETHFSFNEVMKNTKDDGGVSYYARWVGSCDSHYLQKSIWLKGNDEFFNVIRTECGDGVVKWYENGEGCISYSKQHNYHLSHITAFITSYQRINAIEQLLNLEYDKLVRICVDGIYTTQTDFKLCNVFRLKPSCKLGNEAGASYVSNVYKKELPNNEPEYRPNFSKELHLGEGGSGKTHYNLIDKGLCRVLFLSPSWKLARSKNNELGVDCSVWARALTTDVERITEIRNRANVLVVDEVSMLSDDAKNQFFNLYDDMKIIMCGDLGYQLPCITGEEITKTGFDNIVHHNKDFRCNDVKLKEIKTKLRSMIKHNESRTRINKMCMDTFKELGRVISLEELKLKYEISDMILTGTNEIKDYYTNIFKGKFKQEKHYVKENNRLYCNGDIIISDTKPEKCVSEVRHCFTTHSIQGETATNKLFIDSSKMFDSRMFYTAISRAKSLEQIYIIDNNEIIKYKYEHGKIYRIDSKSGVYIGSTIQPLEVRFQGHINGAKQYKNGNGKYITSYKLMDDNDVKITLIENYKCNELSELWKREAEIIQSCKCVNKTFNE